MIPARLIKGGDGKAVKQHIPHIIQAPKDMKKDSSLFALKRVAHPFTHKLFLASHGNNTHVCMSCVSSIPVCERRSRVPAGFAFTRNILARLKQGIS